MKSVDVIKESLAESARYQEIKQDIELSIEQLDAGKGIPLIQTINEIGGKIRQKSSSHPVRSI